MKWAVAFATLALCGIVGCTEAQHDQWIIALGGVPQGWAVPSNPWATMPVVSGDLSRPYRVLGTVKSQPILTNSCTPDNVREAAWNSYGVDADAVIGYYYNVEGPGILTTALYGNVPPHAVCGGTVVTFTQGQTDSHRTAIETEDSPQVMAAKRTKIAKLRDMLDGGTISEQEYDRYRGDVLNNRPVLVLGEK